MPAPFAAALCGFRPTNQNPNTSDNNDKQSIRLGRALFGQLGVAAGALGPSDPGAALEKAVAADLAGLRPDLRVSSSAAVADFEQYEHLGVFRMFKQAIGKAPANLASLVESLEALPSGRERASALRKARMLEGRLVKQQDAISTLLRDAAEESLLGLDVTVASARGAGKPRLEVALSAKWSLRTDRAQDCVSQGAKLVSQRRGRMPHFAVVTMEPRPAMLRILADGSGAVDCVYHLDLAALEAAVRIEATAASASRWAPLETFERLCAQRRLRDYEELRDEVRRI